jgi:hypothetical protein
VRQLDRAVQPVPVDRFRAQQVLVQHHEAEMLRKALRQAFNVNTRPPVEETRWISRNSRAVNDLAKPDALRALLSCIDKKLDGKRAAQDTIRLRRITSAMCREPNSGADAPARR